MYRFLIILILLSSCTNSRIPPKEPEPIKKRDWLQIYENEIMIAIRNEDIEAYHFFKQELLMELLRQSGATNVRIRRVPNVP